MKPALRVLLYQFREDKHSLDLERASFLRSSGLKPEQFRCIDLLKEEPSVDNLRHVSGIILGGSPLSVTQTPHPEKLRECLKIARLTGVAMLGVCFGAQLMADLWGGEVRHDRERREFGTFPITLNRRGTADKLFAGLPPTFDAQCAHHDLIVEAPPGAVVLAKSDRCDVQAFGYIGFGIYGVQFHPERSKEDYERRLALKLACPDEELYEVAAIRASLRDTLQAEAVVKNFIDHHVRPCYPFTFD